MNFETNVNDIIGDLFKLFNPKLVSVSNIKGNNNIYSYHKIVYSNKEFIFDLIKNYKTGIISCKINEINYYGVENIKYKIHSILFDYEYKIIQEELKITLKRIRYYDTIIKILSKKINIDVIIKILKKLD